MLILPKPSGIPSEEWEKAEVEAMNEVIGLYGKTWHFWQVDKSHDLPLGELISIRFPCILSRINITDVYLQAIQL